MEISLETTSESFADDLAEAVGGGTPVTPPSGDQVAVTAAVQAVFAASGLTGDSIDVHVAKSDTWIVVRVARVVREG